MHVFQAVCAQFLAVVLFASAACSSDPNTDVVPDEDSIIVEVDSLFRNPILTSGPDPWVFQHEEYYYLTFTTGGDVTVYRTKDMSDLSGAIKRVVWRAPASGPNSRNIWAPEIHRVQSKWYIYYAADDGNNDNHRMFVLQNENEDPLLGTWQDMGELQLPDDRWAIDGTILEHQDQLYYLWSGWEGASNGRQDIYICEMTDPLTATGERVLLTKPELGWETNGTDPTVVEGPQILKREDKLFVVYSAAGCWTDDYALGLLTTGVDSDLMNPGSWTKSDSPVFAKNPDGGAFGPGHNGFFRSADGTEDWIIYHANAYPGQGCGDARSIRIQPFLWDEEGMPTFGEPHPLNQKLTRPSGEY